MSHDKAKNEHLMTCMHPLTTMSISRGIILSIPSDEQDTYLGTKMQMVKAIWSDIKILFEYYLLDAHNVVGLHSRFRYVLVTWDYIECNNEFSTVISVWIATMFQVWGVHLEEMQSIGWRTTLSLIAKLCQLPVDCISQIITHDEKYVTPTDWKCLHQAMNTLPTISWEDCGQHNSLTLLYLENYTWGIVPYVQTSKAWLKVPKQQRRTSIRSCYRTIVKHKHWSERKRCKSDMSNGWWYA